MNFWNIGSRGKESRKSFQLTEHDNPTGTIIVSDTFRAQVRHLTVFLYRDHLVLLLRVKNLIVPLQRVEKQTMYGKVKLM